MNTMYKAVPEGPSVLEEVDEALWRHRHTAALCVVGCAGMVCVLPEEDVAVCAELQGVAVLLLAGVTPAELEIHPLPLQMALV